MIPAVWKRAPCPSTISGRFARRIRAIALATDCSAGTTASSGTRPSGPPGVAPSGASSSCTSFGTIRCATSRSRIACFIARFASSAWRLPGSTVWLKRATGAKAAARSSSWNAPGPITCVSTCPVIASSGARSTFASHSPVIRFVAPGPAMLKQAAGRPVSFAYAEAANAAAPSWRIPMNVIRPSASSRRIASASPRLEWPTIPKTWRTPQFATVSMRMSATAVPCGVFGGTPT